MKKVTVLTALLMALMLLVSCGGGGTGNPTASIGGTGNPTGNGSGTLTDNLAGRTFFVSFMSDITWAFGTDNTVSYTSKTYNMLGNLIKTVEIDYNYELVDSSHLILYVRDADGNSTGKKILKYYNFGDYAWDLTIEDAIPGNKTLAEMAEEYWFPEFATNYSETPFLKLFEDDGVFMIAYKNNTYNDTYENICCYLVNDNTITAGTITATKAAAADGGKEGYPETLTFTYTTSGSGNNLKLNVSVDCDSNQYELTWTSHYDWLDEVTD